VDDVIRTTEVTLPHATMPPSWTVLPFFALVLAMAVLPITSPRAWEKPGFQAAVCFVCSAPVAVYLLAYASGGHAVMSGAIRSYFSFVSTLAALYVISSGIHVSGDIAATPRVNVGFLVVGSLLASAIGTTGASMLLIRPFLRTNSQRANTAHLVPFFILAVANAGGLLTPVGDPPLLVGYLEGVPFFWTLRLAPIWILYVGWFAAALYLVERRAYAAEAPAALEADRGQRAPLVVQGKANVALLLLILPAVLLPPGAREVSMLALAVTSLATTSRQVQAANDFSWGPIVDVAIIFAGLFVCLGPVEQLLSCRAPSMPLQRSWQIFWGSGLLSSVLDNAPTYTAFAALSRGLSAGHEGLVAGIDPLKLAAVSAGSVVMGATTYIGNGPNLMVKAIAARQKFRTPGFFRYAAFAFAVMLPAHVIVTGVLIALER
jgi:Na+/H+ antiporter NhaD/arsenite permease-like protein